MKISIVFPVYNEEDNLQSLISDWHKKLNEVLINKFEFVIVEDGSTDKTKDIIKELEKNYPVVNLSQIERRGYTKAVLDGIKGSNGEYVLCTDSDNQIKVDSLIENINNLPKENQFLFGYRNPRKDPFNRLLYSSLFKIYHDLLFNSKLKDPSCPFVIGKKTLFMSLPFKELSKMKEGFWWGFVATSRKMKIKFDEVEIEHFKRSEGDAGYQLNQMPGIILRNTIGLFKIKFSKF